jgi:hypothetical protein
MNPLPSETLSNLQGAEHAQRIALMNPTQSQHTPFPLHVHDDGQAWPYIRGAHGKPVCSLEIADLDETLAVARLIVRAVNGHADLLATCEAIAALADGQGRANLIECAAQARAAIARARGQA